MKTAQKWIDGALAQDGCIHYNWSADLNKLKRANVSEEWESEEALAHHFANKEYAGMLAHMGSFGIENAVSRKYRLDAEGPVYGAEGKPTEKFG